MLYVSVILFLLSGCSSAIEPTEPKTKMVKGTWRSSHEDKGFDFSTLSGSVSNSLADNLSLKYHWETIPTIEVCKDATITENQIKQALDYWKSEGVEVGFQRIQQGDCSSKQKNVIQIM